MRSKPETSLAQEFSFSKSNGRLLSVSWGEGICNQICILKESLWLHHEGHLGGARWAWRPWREMTPATWDMGAMWTSDGEGERLDGVERHRRSNIGRA